MLSSPRYYYTTLFRLVMLWLIYEERRSSLVERDINEDVTLNPVIFDTLDESGEYSSVFDTSPVSVTKKLNSNTEPDTCAISDYSTTTEATKSYEQIIREAVTSKHPHPRNFKRVSMITAQTTVRTDRCMTELTLLNPFSYDKQQIVHLGIYIATFRQYGDHVVYKMSPLSPFYSLNLREQDRLVKVNGFDVTNWSHSALLNFFLHLSHNDQARFNTEKVTKFTIEIEFLKPSPPAASSNPQHRPRRFTAIVHIIMQENGRITLRSTSVNPISVTYLNRTSCSLLKLGSSSNRYVKIEEVNVETGNSSTPTTETVLRVIEGERILGDKNAEITFHEFDVSPRNQPGKIVAMETFRQGFFLHAGNSTAGTSLSLISNTDSSNIQNITSSESRLFRIFSSEGNILSKIVHIESGLYLKAENGVVSLATSPVTNSMLFRVFQC